MNLNEVDRSKGDAWSKIHHGRLHLLVDATQVTRDAFQQGLSGAIRVRGVEPHASYGGPVTLYVNGKQVVRWTGKRLMGQWVPVVPPVVISQRDEIELTPRTAFLFGDLVDPIDGKTNLRDIIYGRERPHPPISEVAEQIIRETEARKAISFGGIEREAPKEPTAGAFELWSGIKARLVAAAADETTLRALHDAIGRVEADDQIVRFIDASVAYFEELKS